MIRLASHRLALAERYYGRIDYWIIFRALPTRRDGFPIHLIGIDGLAAATENRQFFSNEIENTRPSSM
jgi:hypothetical protein